MKAIVWPELTDNDRVLVVLWWIPQPSIRCFDAPRSQRPVPVAKCVEVRVCEGTELYNFIVLQFVY